MRVLVCGDRNWTDYASIERVLDQLPRDGLVIIEGGARGADFLAALWAKRNDVPFTTYPAEWDKYGKAAGPIRNRQMLEEGRPDRVIAFHPKLFESKGTKDMVARASKAGVPFEVYHGVIEPSPSQP